MSATDDEEKPKGKRMSRARALVRVHDLIRRAQETTFEEEARTCAILAVREMKKYDLKVVIPQKARGKAGGVDDPRQEAWAWRAPSPSPPRSPPPWAGRTYDPGAPGPFWDGAKGVYRDPFVEQARQRVAGTLFCVPGCSIEHGHMSHCPRAIYERSR